MPLRLDPLTHVDIPAITTFNHAAFSVAEDTFKRDIFCGPNGSSAEGCNIARRFFEEDIGSFLDEHWFKVVDDAAGDEVVACACWAVFEEDPWSRDGDGKGVNKRMEAAWLETEGWEDYREYCEEWLEALNVGRKAMRELRRRGHLHLYLLFTSPSHFRRGAGSLLIRWGTEKADALGLPCVVEASTYAHRNGIYHKHGFLDYEVKTFNDAAQEDRKAWPKLPPTECFVMYRPAKGEGWRGPSAAV